MEQRQAIGAPVPSQSDVREGRSRIQGSRVTIFVILLLFGLVTFLPFYFLAETSIKSPSEATRIPLTWFPQSFTLQNFQEAIGIGFPRAVANGLIYAVVGTVLAVFISALIGFVIVKHPSVFGNILFWSIIASTLMPLASYVVTLVGLLSRITQLTHIPMIDTYWGLIIPRIVYAFGVFMMRQTMLSVPDELLDAARADGAGTFRQFWQIALPIVRPQTITLSMLIFMGLYGEFLWPLVATKSSEMQVTSVWLAVQTSAFGVNPGLISAASILVIIPMLVIFLLGQRYITSGLGLTGFR
jgi:multiple sugar transport system permease protein